MRYKQNLRIDGSRVYSYNTHVATIDHSGRRLMVHGWWSVTTSKHVNHVAETYGLTVVKDAPKPDADKEKENDNGGGILKMVAGVAALASIFTSNQKESNDWKARMMKAGLTNRGLIMPDDWDQLSEEEKTKRLDKALAVIA